MVPFWKVEVPLQETASSAPTLSFPPMRVEDAIERKTPGVAVPMPILVLRVSKERRGVVVAEVEVAILHTFTRDAGMVEVDLP